MIIFSKSDFSEKVKFLFEIFDLNEMNKISLIELQFLIKISLISILKIIDINILIDDEKIENFVK